MPLSSLIVRGIRATKFFRLAIRHTHCLFIVHGLGAIKAGCLEELPEAAEEMGQQVQSSVFFFPFLFSRSSCKPSSYVHLALVKRMHLSWLICMCICLLTKLTLYTAHLS